MKRVKLLQQSKRSIDISIHKHKEEFHLKLKIHFHVFQSTLEENRNVTIVNKKQTNSIDEIAKKIAGIIYYIIV